MRLVAELTLTEPERALFATLLAAAKRAGRATVLRVAGGWVRTMEKLSSHRNTKS